MRIQPVKLNVVIPLSLMGVVLSLSTSAIANETPIRSVEEVEAPETVTGSSEDLRGLESNNWQWEVGEEWGNIDYSVEKESSTEISTPDVRPEEAGDWENNTGEPANPSTGIPLTTF